jgi:hypothetical protein
VGIKKSLSAVNELKQVQMFSVVEIEKPVVANFLKSNQANSDRERTVNEQNNNENQSENNNTNNNTKAKIASVDKNNNNYSFNSVKNVVSKNSNYTRSFSNNNINFAYNSKSPNFINKVKNGMNTFHFFSIFLFFFFVINKFHNIKCIKREI